MRENGGEENIHWNGRRDKVGRDPDYEDSDVDCRALGWR
jgi:hypothetical protein